MPIDLLIHLLPADKRGLWLLYLRFIRLGNKHFGFEQGRRAFKKEKLRLLEKYLYRDVSKPLNITAQLKQVFKNEKLSISLLADLLTVWRYTSSLEPPLNEKRLSDIIGYSASPVARMIIALNNENPSIYLPFCSLVSAVLFLQMTKDKSPLLQGAKWSLKQKRSKLKGWLKNAKVLLSVAGSAKLKFRLALLFSRLNLYARYFQNNKQRKFGVLDELKIFLYSMWLFMTIRHKSVKIKGM